MENFQFEKILELKTENLVWGFETGKPYLKFKKLFSDYTDIINVDPFPCSKHDRKILEKCVEDTESKFRIGAPLRWIIVPLEGEGRTNATAHSQGIWSNEEAEKKYLIEPYVALYGKRTIVHPAMTRYLVAHEYGHIVDYWISANMKKKLEKNDEDIFRRQYAEMRGVPLNNGSYGGGKWIDNIAEIIADDFRIAVAGVDKDFYVHSCVHPLEDKNVKAFWKKMKKLYSV